MPSKSKKKAKHSSKNKEETDAKTEIESLNCSSEITTIDSGESRDNEDTENSSENEEVVCKSSKAEQKNSNREERSNLRPHRPSGRETYQKSKDPSENKIEIEKREKKTDFSKVDAETEIKTCTPISLSFNEQIFSPLKLPFSSGLHNRWVICLLIIIPVCVAVYSTNSPKVTQMIKIESIKQEFPKQTEILWRAVASGINDTLRFERPTSFMFLYENGTEKTLQKILKKISYYAVCSLSNCDEIPIDLNSEISKSSYLSQTNDYGSVIAGFKDDLKRTGVMVIENLDLVPGEYARAFHSFCDEVSPLVKKSVFFFTLKVNRFNERALFDLKDIEKRLKENWNNIEDDYFFPLFTRISAMPLRILPE